MLNERIGSALRALGEKGFVSKGNRAGRRTFEGVLGCAKGPVPVRLTIDDWNFLHYPSIRLLERPAFLSAMMPHVDIHNDLCYFAPGVVVLDRYRPDEAILQCLHQATLVLDRIAADPAYRSDDIQNEFLAHWEFGQASPPWPVLLGTIRPDAISSNYFLLGDGDERRAMIADDASEVSNLCRVRGWSAPKATSCKCWIFQTANPPAVPEEALPTTVKELFAWLCQWDRALYNGIQRVLERQGEYLDYPFVSFAVDSPVGWIGFSFELDQVKRLGSKRSPGLYRQHLHGKGGSRAVIRLAIMDVSPSFVHSRNLAFEDLRGRKITLIGCGAIGGYLAQALIRLGAGSGNGSITLVDPDELGPENLGRHFLGYPALFRYKADALRDELLRQFPHAQVVAQVRSVDQIGRLFGADLVINATGEEAVCELLNEMRLRCGARAAPLLQVWIKGNGEVVQSLWNDGPEHGCFRCLYLAGAVSNRQERFRVLKQEPERRFVGCRAFTPYAVSSPMSAASLATDAVVDWMRGDPSPRFRTRVTEGANVQHVKNQNILRLNGCPACAAR